MGNGKRDGNGYSNFRSGKGMKKTFPKFGNGKGIQINNLQNFGMGRE